MIFLLFSALHCLYCLSHINSYLSMLSSSFLSLLPCHPPDLPPSLPTSHLLLLALPSAIILSILPSPPFTSFCPSSLPLPYFMFPSVALLYKFLFHLSISPAPTAHVLLLSPSSSLVAFINLPVFFSFSFPRSLLAYNIISTFLLCSSLLLLPLHFPLYLFSNLCSHTYLSFTLPFVPPATPSSPPNISGFCLILVPF